MASCYGGFNVRGAGWSTTDLAQCRGMVPARPKNILRDSSFLGVSEREFDKANRRQHRQAAVRVALYAFAPDNFQSAAPLLRGGGAVGLGRGTGALLRPLQLWGQPRRFDAALVSRLGSVPSASRGRRFFRPDSSRRVFQRRVFHIEISVGGQRLRFAGSSRLSPALCAHPGRVDARHDGGGTDFPFFPPSQTTRLGLYARSVSRPGVP